MYNFLDTYDKVKLNQEATNYLYNLPTTIIIGPYRWTTHLSDF